MKKRITLLFIILFNLFVMTVYGQNQKKTDSLFTLLKTAKEDTTRVVAYTGLCWEFNSSNPDTSLYFGNMGLKLAIKTNNKKGISDCFYFLSVVYFYIGNYDKAIEYNLNALKIYKELDRKKLIPECYNNIGIIYGNQGKYDKTIDYFFKSLKIYNELGDKSGMAVCYLNIGNVYNYLGNYNQAIEYFIKGLKIYEELGDKKAVSMSYNNIGIVYADQGDYDKALEYYLMALKIKEELSDIKGMSACYNNIGLVYDNQFNYKKALEYYLKALKIMEELSDIKGMSACYVNIGGIYKNLCNYDDALKYFSKALEIGEKIDDKNGMASLYGNLATLNETLADSIALSEKQRINYLNKSVEYGIKSLELAKEIKAIPIENNAANALLSAYKKLGNFKKSIEYAEIFIATNDSMFKEEKTKAIAEMQTKYETEKKDKEIIIKSNELKVKEIAITNKNRALVFSITGSAILLLLLTFALLQYRRKNRAYKNLVIQNLNILNKEEELKALKEQKESDQRTLNENTAAVQNLTEVPPRTIDEIKNETGLSTGTTGEKYAGSALKDEQKQEIVRRLNVAMSTDKIYLNAGLTIDDLAEKLSTNKNYLSQVINEKYGMNFNNFINKHRIDEAQRIFANSTNVVQIKTICFELGFKSYGSFYSAFEKQTGVTPAKFRKFAKK